MWSLYTMNAEVLESHQAPASQVPWSLMASTMAAVIPENADISKEGNIFKKY